MKTATNVLIFASAFAAYGFAGRFLITTWFRTVAGRVVAAIVTAAIVIFSLATVGTVFGPDYPGRTGIRFACYLLTTIILWWALAVLVADQARTRRKAQRHDE